MIDLLRGNVVYGRTRRHTDDVRGVTGRVAADIRRRGVFDALLCVCVFGLAGCEPVFFLGFGVDDEPGEGIWVMS
jgi:hypothetical protein